MKKWIACLLGAMLALLPALAEAPVEENPVPQLPEIVVAPEVTEAPVKTPEHDLSSGESITLELDGRRVTLDFDSSPQYSSVEGGLVQASYYSYSEDGSQLFELYLIFPETAQPGMIITPEYAALTGAESSVVLIVSDARTQAEQYYFSSLMDGGAYPAGSAFTIAIDDIREADGATTYAGRLSATLVALDMATGETAATLTIAETPFSFTLNGASGERHADPPPTETPNPDDMRKV